ncbi:hypothetical protein ACKVMT_11320 [Halobacteriales archaeon Cl-PHB]
MAETPNHGYNVPSEGTTDWHVPLNENFERFDADVEIRDVGPNRPDYDPKQGAKFFETSTGRVWVGDGSNWNAIPTTGYDPEYSSVVVGGQASTTPSLTLGTETGGYLFDYAIDEVLSVMNTDTQYLLGLMPTSRQVAIGKRTAAVPLDVLGQNNWDVDTGDGDVRIGDADHRLAIGVALAGGGAGACNIRAKGGIDRLNLGAGTSGHTVQIDPDAVSVNGDLDVSGNKNFAQAVETDDGEREVVYTASEAPTARTELSGVAELEDGRAVVDLPDHFGWVTSDDEPLVVQVTPHATEPVRPQVTDRSTDRFVVEEVGDGPQQYEVSYTVRGTRAGQADKQVIRDPAGEHSFSKPATAEADD